jgi:hypothetical protein
VRARDIKIEALRSGSRTGAKNYARYRARRKSELGSIIKADVDATAAYGAREWTEPFPAEEGGVIHLPLIEEDVARILIIQLSS